MRKLGLLALSVSSAFATPLFGNDDECVDLNSGVTADSGSNWKQDKRCDDGSSFALLSGVSLKQMLNSNQATDSLEHFAMGEVYSFIFTRREEYAAIRVQNETSPNFDPNECHIFPVDQRQLKVLSQDISNLEPLLPLGSLDDNETCEDIKASVAAIVFIKFAINSLIMQFPDEPEADIVHALKTAGELFSIASAASIPTSQNTNKLASVIYQSSDRVETIPLSGEKAAEFEAALFEKGLVINGLPPDFSMVDPETVSPLGWGAILISDAMSGKVVGQISYVHPANSETLIGFDNGPRYLLSSIDGQLSLEDIWASNTFVEPTRVSDETILGGGFISSGFTTTARLARLNEETGEPEFPSGENVFSIEMHGYLQEMAQIVNRYSVDFSRIPFPSQANN